MAKGNFIVEVDGVARVRATTFKGGDLEHEESEIWEGGLNHAHIESGTYKVSAVEIGHAQVLGTAGDEFYAKFRDYLDRVDLTKLNIRVISLQDDGVTPMVIDEYTDCVPKKFAPEDREAKSNDPTMFTISFRPTDHFRL